MSDFFPLDGVALPQLRTRCPGDRVEIPNVSPGQTDVSPNSRETWSGSDSQPRLVEKARSFDNKIAGHLIANRDYQALDQMVIEHLLGH